MPVSPEVWRVQRNHHEVTDPDTDVLVATGAEVHLPRLIRLDAVDLYLGRRTHPSNNSTTMKAAATKT
jgi:hypothetical protein